MCGSNVFKSSQIKYLISFKGKRWCLTGITNKQGQNIYVYKRVKVLVLNNVPARLKARPLFKRSVTVLMKMHAKNKNTLVHKEGIICVNGTLLSSPEGQKSRKKKKIETLKTFTVTGL